VQLDDDAFRTVFRASPIKRIKRHRFIRNVLIALANAGLEDARAPMLMLCNDPHPVIADTARWALAQLDNKTKPPQ